MHCTLPSHPQLVTNLFDIADYRVKGRLRDDIIIACAQCYLIIVYLQFIWLIVDQVIVLGDR